MAKTIERHLREIREIIRARWKASLRAVN